MRLHGSPHKIALGAALGMFIAITPTFGIQLILAFIIASIFRASRPAALISVWVTNIFTLAPIYAFCYLVGAVFVPDADLSMREVYGTMTQLVVSLGSLSFWEIWSQTKVVARLGWDMFLPMLIGGCIVGAVAGAATYPVVYWGVKRYRTVKEMLKHVHLPHLHRTSSAETDDAANATEADHTEAATDQREQRG
jgi:uncharacterized protein